MLVAVLTRMYRDERHRAPFTDALPVAGVDGTLEGRMKDTKAQGNARAKTGSIANTRSLSGFVTSADGEPLVFSMIVNNFNVPASDADGRHRSRGGPAGRSSGADRIPRPWRRPSLCTRSWS